jgi:2-polyprenyl-6-methoxyphenol hydroxylase-like FAD-dependent oxidoreductase
MAPQERVAIVGSGLAGLVSAHLLHHDRRQRYAVKVFESVSTQVQRRDDEKY